MATKKKSKKRTAISDTVPIVTNLRLQLEITPATKMLGVVYECPSRKCKKLTVGTALETRAAAHHVWV